MYTYIYIYIWTIKLVNSSVKGDIAALMCIANIHIYLYIQYVNIL